MPTELHVSVKLQNVIILVGITTSCAMNQGDSSDAVVVPCVIKLESAVCLKVMLPKSRYCKMP